MAQSETKNEAYVTLATNQSYALGALTLGQSLLQTGTTRKLVCMVTKQLQGPLRQKLSEIYRLEEVDVMDSSDSSNLELLQRPDLGITFTKLHCWRLVDFKKCVFLDADTLVLQNIDELFDREELSAAPDIGWPDCFNSGVFVFTPSHETYFKLLQFALEEGSFDGGDQGLLNSYFSDWARKDIKNHLPFLYNVVANDFYTYLPALKRYGKDAKLVHFIGAKKPWMYSFDEGRGVVDGGPQGGVFYRDFLNAWWRMFQKHAASDDDSFQQLLTQIQSLSFHQPPIQHLGDAGRRQQWEQGNIDYTGVDSFQFIQQKIDSKVVRRDVGGSGEGVKDVGESYQPLTQSPLTQPSQPALSPQIPVKSNPVSIKTSTHQPPLSSTKQPKSPSVIVVTKARDDK